MIKKILGLAGSVVLLNIFFILQPNALFAYHHQHAYFNVHSDQPIGPEIEAVLEDATQRLKHSALFEENSTFNLYLCNENWRFTFFTRSQNAGGVVNFVLSPNIFLRESDIATNSLIPPETWRFPLDDRPLSYFIAHEATHALQREWDPWLPLTCDPSIIEGYAEYVAKSSTHDLESLISAFHNKDPKMDANSGLYDRYHLFVAYLMDQKGYSFAQLVEEQPNIESVLVEISRHERGQALELE